MKKLLITSITIGNIAKIEYFLLMNYLNAILSSTETFIKGELFNAYLCKLLHFAKKIRSFVLSQEDNIVFITAKLLKQMQKIV